MVINMKKKINFLNKILLLLSFTILTACGTTYSHRSGDNTNLSLDSRSCSNQANINAPTYLCRNPLMCAPDETALVFDSIARNNAVYDQCMLQKGYQPQ